MRDLKRIQFLPVDHPRVDIECGGHVIQVDHVHSTPHYGADILEFNDNKCKEESKLFQHGKILGHRVARARNVLPASHYPGGGLQVQFNYFSMSENVTFLIFRSFGRFTLVGTHTINSIHRFLYNPITRAMREEQERMKIPKIGRLHEILGRIV